MSNNVRTRVLGESGAWVEADNPAERLPKMRRFILTASVPPQSASRPDAPTHGGVVGEGVCFSDGHVAVWRRIPRSTTVYDDVQDVIVSGSDVLTWID